MEGVFGGLGFEIKRTQTEWTGAHTDSAMNKVMNDEDSSSFETRFEEHVGFLGSASLMP